MLLVRLVLEQVRTHHWCQRERNDERQDERNADGYGEFLEQLADIAAHQEQRDEYRDQRQRYRNNGETDLARTLEGGFHGGEALFEVTNDVFDHHNGIVDHEADPDRERHERQIVEAIAEFIQHRESTDERKRHGDGRNDRRPEVTQEHEDHHHHECDRQDQRELDVGNRGADGGRAVGCDRHLDGRRERSLELRQHCLYGVHRLDDVGTGHTLNGENDGALLVEPAGHQVVFRRFDRFSDVANAHRRAVAIGNDQIIVGRWLEQLVVGTEREGLARTVERAFREIDVGLAYHGADVFQADAAGRERLGIDLNADGRLDLAADADQADARHSRNLREQDAFRIGIDGGQRQRIRSEGEKQYGGVGRIHLPDRRRIRYANRQKWARRVDRSQDVRCRTVHGSAEHELNRELGEAKRARRGQLRHAGNLGQLLLERRRHRGRHRLGIGARQLRGNLDRREIDVRQSRDRQQPVRDQPAQQQPRHQQRCGDRPMDEGG